MMSLVSDIGKKSKGFDIPSGLEKSSLRLQPINKVVVPVKINRLRAIMKKLGNFRCTS